MSTADSQILVCSAAITEDLFPSLEGRYLANKLATAGVCPAALSASLASCLAAARARSSRAISPSELRDCSARALSWTSLRTCTARRFA